jgi:adenylosuccinate lyase
MPHKRNADVCERIVVLARLAAAQVTAAYQGLSSDHERDGRSYWLEWAYLPDVSHYTLAAAKLTEQILHSLSLRPAVMWRRLAESADQVGSERLMFHLAPSMGKQNAHHWVYEQSQHAQQAGRSLTDHLAANPQPDILPDDLTHILDPMNHLGHTARIAESLATRAMRCVHETK